MMKLGIRVLTREFIFQLAPQVIHVLDFDQSMKITSYYIEALIEEEELDYSLDKFSARFLKPMVNNMAGMIRQSEKAGTIIGWPPHTDDRVAQFANEALSGVAVLGVLIHDLIHNNYRLRFEIPTVNL